MIETQNASAFALVGANLIANGYSAIPIEPMGKRPDAFLGTEWQRFCNRLPTQLEVDIWSKRPVGVGVALGAASRGLVVIDIDVEDVDVIEAIESRWPSTVRKVGRTGYSAFYWASPAVRARSFRRSSGGVDLLAHCRQSVVPPSIHPVTREPYRWLTPRTLENTIIDALPMLPDDVAAQLAEALEPFGYTAPVEREPFDHSAGGGDNEWSETNEVALANLSAWVEDLGIGARKEGASWRGNARRDGDSFALSFHPNGIMDFVTREGYSPIDIVAKIADIKPRDAMRRLREKLGLYVEPELPPVRFTFRKGSAWETLARDTPEAGGGAEEQPERKAIGSAKAWAEAKAPLAGFMFDGDMAPEPSPMLIKRMLPAQGICFNGGQSGVGKTFLMCHGSACLGAGKPFFGYRVHERVGSAIFAAEGAFTMPNRIAVARQRITTAPKLPISWLGNVPNLSDPREIDAMIPRLEALSARFGDEFGVRLGAMWLDTLSAACDIQDEDDNSEAARVGRQLQRLAAETGTVVVPSHHYGKNQDTGLRGASAWRALCDVVWSAIGERNHLTGDIKNRRLALAKSRDDEEGVISGFDIKFAGTG
ncbi:MAG TPA: AAA family ATPase [Roseiarcus sp.]|jgi:hypothetical protein|nr:AAA family ATPase [Roseiarcus sp.]